ncbi:hypothetical protein OGAPHI_000123 [Ogataea philodendri]|uniref:Uncharacterized protein n=1 Tax=Ogataea philodendri TaxID=1378263 RepID=A0A9P8PIK0_9ASCO|nr:uncharacterized protein OGAPHI_000123 [Ogataea philodendri]KAH3671937.1 hypothetical protein OGAPHI_000123 [Ogataea philodendri]
MLLGSKSNASLYDMSFHFSRSGIAVDKIANSCSMSCSWDQFSSTEDFTHFSSNSVPTCTLGHGSWYLELDMPIVLYVLNADSQALDRFENIRNGCAPFVDRSTFTLPNNNEKPPMSCRVSVCEPISCSHFSGAKSDWRNSIGMAPLDIFPTQSPSFGSL